MRSYIANLHSHEASGHEARFLGDGGSLVISCFAGGVVRFCHVFDAAQPDPRAMAAAGVMTDGWQTRLKPLPVQVSADAQGFTLHLDADTRIVLDSATGTPAVYHKGVLQHGGFMGDGDTVIPAYPARVITDGSEKPVFRLNFPKRQGDSFFGLGDKSGHPDRAGRRFSMYNRDALGYDAKSHDPLYKSVPFFIRRNAANGVLQGLFLAHPAIRWVDLGQESPYYYAMESVGGPFDYWLILGDTWADLLQGYCGITGLPALPPWCSFGFFGSSMNYVEPEDAPERVLRFFEEVERRQIPCEGMYLSSGYLKADDGKRYALLWNTGKFPNYGDWLGKLAKRGYNLLMNIKPGFLTSHPWYEQVKEQGFFIKDSTGLPVVEYFWGGPASFLDFTNKLARRWWMDQLKAQYLDHGCTGIWNDNNELELEDTQLDAWLARPVYPVLMAQASYEAFLEKKPEERPWVYSRAGTAGLQRYARTWTGDNRSDFDTLGYNQFMGASLGISGLPFVGHDLGGFFGETPSEELLVRSCETGVFQSRFVIHSWRPDGVPTEPWTYPGSAEIIRSLILEHYRFMPYIYNCAMEAAITGLPPDRLPCLEYPQDDKLQSDEVNLLFGPFVLKLNAVRPGQRTQPVQLPDGTAWYDPRSGTLYKGGQKVDIPVPMDGKAHYLLREGTILPTNPNCSRSQTPCLAHTEFVLVPGKDSSYIYREDDGRTLLHLGRFNEYHFALNENECVVSKEKTGYMPEGEGRVFTLCLPEGMQFEENGLITLSFDPDSLNEHQPVRVGIRGAMYQQGL